MSAADTIEVRIEPQVINCILAGLRAGMREAVALPSRPSGAQVLAAMQFAVGRSIAKLGVPLDLDGAVSDELAALAAGYCEGVGIDMLDAGEAL